MMAIAILGQTLTSGGEQGGSYALGKVHNQVRLDLAETDALALDETITQQIIRPVIELNLGPTVPIPHWRSIIEEPEDLPQLATVVKTLVEAGAQIPHSYVREKFNLPAPEAGEPILVPVGPAGPMLAHQIIEPRVALMPARAALPPGRAMLNEDEPPAAPNVVRRELGEAWMRERRVATPEAWDALSPAGRQRVWYASGLATERVGALADLFMEAVADRHGRGWWLDRMEFQGISVTGADEAGEGQLPLSRAMLQWEHNSALINGAEAWGRAWEGRNERPYLQYHAMRDGNTRPDHLALDGTTLAIDHPFWNDHTPPWAIQCRCWITSMNDRDLPASGLSNGDVPHVRTDPGFSFNRQDGFYIAARGGEPVTEIGRADAGILAGLALPDASSGGA